MAKRPKTEELPNEIPCMGSGPVVIDGPQRKQFGAHLKNLRRQRGLSQQELANRAGLAVDTVRRIEMGGFSPSLETLSRLVNGLEISLFTLFAGLDGQRFAQASAFWDFLCSRRETELRLARRVLGALFEGISAEGV